MSLQYDSENKQINDRNIRLTRLIIARKSFSYNENITNL